MLRSLRNSIRLLAISLTLARHDALFPLEAMRISPPLTLLFRLLARKQPHMRKGERLARALEELGPTFVKLGQVLSTRADLVGEEIAADLAGLRDNLPPFPFEEVRHTIEQEFGVTLDSLFEQFEETSVAAASIAQVHFAVTTDGKEVAVKILRPEIEAAFARDIDLFFWLAERVEKSLPTYRRLKPLEVVQLFQNSIRLELDLRYEAGSCVELATHLKHDTGFVVPDIFWTLTAQRVMTMTRITGTPIANSTELIAKGHNPDAILENLARSFFIQVFRDGFFHADLHPGNLFVLENGDVAAVDFGIMGRLGKANRIYVAEILYGFLKEDYAHVAKVHFDAGWVPAHKSVENFTLACMAIGKPIMGRPLSEISVGRLLGQLFKITDMFEMETQVDLLMLQKTMVLVEGVGRMLNPNINMWQLTEPLIGEWVKEHLGAQAKIKQAAEDAASFARKLPSLFINAEAALTRRNAGGMRLHPDSIAALSENRKRLHRQWLTFAWTALITFVLINLLG